MKKPIIAVTVRVHEYQNIKWLSDTKDFLDAILTVGGLPVIVYCNEVMDVETIAEMCDGLLVTGGEDINPEIYNQENKGARDMVPLWIDKLDELLIRKFYSKKKPILGICRGIQCLNVSFGGSLIQDIKSSIESKEKYPHQQHLQFPENKYEDTTSHKIVIAKNSILHELMRDDVEVNSFHHQCIGKVAEGFRVTAYSKDDHIIEAIERENIIGVQWHPEWLMQKESNRNIFQYFVDLSRK